MTPDDAIQADYFKPKRVIVDADGVASITSPMRFDLLTKHKTFQADEILVASPGKRHHVPEHLKRRDLSGVCDACELRWVWPRKESTVERMSCPGCGAAMSVHPRRDSGDYGIVARWPIVVISDIIAAITVTRMPGLIAKQNAEARTRREQARLAEQRAEDDAARGQSTFGLFNRIDLAVG